jgi:hypothetical protein
VQRQGSIDVKTLAGKYKTMEPAELIKVCERVVCARDYRRLCMLCGPGFSEWYRIRGRYCVYAKAAAGKQFRKTGFDNWLLDYDRLDGTLHALHGKIIYCKHNGAVLPLPYAPEGRGADGVDAMA